MSSAELPIVLRQESAISYLCQVYWLISGLYCLTTLFAAGRTSIYRIRHLLHSIDFGWGDSIVWLERVQQQAQICDWFRNGRNIAAVGMVDSQSPLSSVTLISPSVDPAQNASGRQMRAKQQASFPLNFPGVIVSLTTLQP